MTEFTTYHFRLNIGSSEGGHADYCVMFGNVGFPYFDKRRGFYMVRYSLKLLCELIFATRFPLMPPNTILGIGNDFNSHGSLYHNLWLLQPSQG